MLPCLFWVVHSADELELVYASVVNRLQQAGALSRTTTTRLALMYTSWKYGLNGRCHAVWEMITLLGPMIVPVQFLIYTSSLSSMP